MTDSADSQIDEAGPACYRNWHAQAKGAPVYALTEYPIYSDASIALPGANALTFGPFVLVNAHPVQQPDPTFVLAIHEHLDPSKLPSQRKTDVSGYTGAWPEDEIAALLSLILGTRLMAGGPTRQNRKGEWVIQGDLERPAGLWGHAKRKAVLPRALDSKQLPQATLLPTLPGLAAAVATALLRSARSYRDGLWVAESEPELAWLMFVSALEVAAVQQQLERSSLMELLTLSKPSLVQQLETVGGSALVDTVAQALKGELRATRRFLDFMQAFAPGPPTQRPPKGFQLDWSERNLRRGLDKVYSHRSKALHEGVPFPPPMCRAPLQAESGWDAPSETVLGGIAFTTGGAWEREDLPFSLHTFEYLTRGALLNWWTSLVGAQLQEESTQATLAAPPTNSALGTPIPPDPDVRPGPGPQVPGKDVTAPSGDTLK